MNWLGPSSLAMLWFVVHISAMAYFTVPPSNPEPLGTATLPGPLPVSPPLIFNLTAAKIGSSESGKSLCWNMTCKQHASGRISRTINNPTHCGNVVSVLGLVLWQQEGLSSSHNYPKVLITGRFLWQLQSLKQQHQIWVCSHGAERRRHITAATWNVD